MILQLNVTRILELKTFKSVKCLFHFSFFLFSAQRIQKRYSFVKIELRVNNEYSFRHRNRGLSIHWSYLLWDHPFLSLCCWQIWHARWWMMMPVGIPAIARFWQMETRIMEGIKTEVHFARRRNHTTSFLSIWRTLWSLRMMECERKSASNI